MEGRVVTEVERLKARISTLEHAICDAYDIAGARGKGSCAAIRRRLKRFADERAERFSAACDEAVRTANNGRASK